MKASYAIAFAFCLQMAGPLWAGCGEGEVVAGSDGNYYVNIPCSEPTITFSNSGDPWQTVANPGSVASDPLGGYGANQTGGTGAQQSTPTQQSSGGGGGGGGGGRLSGNPLTPPNSSAWEAPSSGSGGDLAYQNAKMQHQAQDAAAAWQAQNAAHFPNPQTQLDDQIKQMQSNGLAAYIVMNAFKTFEVNKLNKLADNAYSSLISQHNEYSNAIEHLQGSILQLSSDLSEKISKFDELSDKFNNKMKALTSDHMKSISSNIKNSITAHRAISAEQKVAASLARRSLSIANVAKTSDQSYLGALIGIAASMTEIAKSGNLDPHSALVQEAITGKLAASGQVLSVSQAALADLTVTAHSPMSSAELSKIEAGRPKARPDANPWIGRALSAVQMTPSSTPPSAIVMNQRITASYATMYLQNPRLYQWMGLAAYASSKVGEGLRSASDETMAELNDPPLAAAAFALNAPLPARLFEALRIGNNAVFMDMYWQHIAYSAGGIEAMRSSAAAGLLDPTMLSAWESLDAAKQSFASGQYTLGTTQVNDATEKMAFYEQKTVLQAPVFGPYSKEFSWLADTPFYPGKEDAMSSPVPGGAPFSGDNLGTFDQRWGWFKTNIFPDWQSYQSSNPQKIKMDMQTFINNNK